MIPTLHQTYTRTCKDGREFSRTPIEIVDRLGASCVRYMIGRGDYRICTLEKWGQWLQAAA